MRFCWLSGCRELNPVYTHPKRAYYRYTTPRERRAKSEKLVFWIWSERTGSIVLDTPRKFSPILLPFEFFFNRLETSKDFVDFLRSNRKMRLLRYHLIGSFFRYLLFVANTRNDNLIADE